MKKSTFHYTLVFFSYWKNHTIDHDGYIIVGDYSIATIDRVLKEEFEKHGYAMSIDDYSIHKHTVKFSDYDDMIAKIDTYLRRNHVGFTQIIYNPYL